MTASHTFSHFFRQVKGRSHRTHILLGRSAFFRIRIVVRQFGVQEKSPTEKSVGLLGLASIERCLATRIKPHFLDSTSGFVPRFVPRFGVGYPGFRRSSVSLWTPPHPGLFGHPAPPMEFSGRPPPLVGTLDLQASITPSMRTQGITPLLINFNLENARGRIHPWLGSPRSTLCVKAICQATLMCSRCNSDGVRITLVRDAVEGP